MLKQLCRTRGETMIEVLVALMILVVGAVGAFRLFGLATVNNQLTKERVIATNLAREGIEVVRNIRDTNWLRFAGERRKCWNNNDPAQCTTNYIKDGVSYIVKFAPSNYRWELDDTGAGILDLSDGIDSFYQLYENDGVYNHASGAGSDPSIYYREIYTEYLNDTATGLTTESTETDANILRITSKVEWLDRGKISNVILTAIVTDYLGRSDHK